MGRVFLTRRVSLRSFQNLLMDASLMGNASLFSLCAVGANHPTENCDISGKTRMRMQGVFISTDGCALRPVIVWLSQASV